MATKRMDIRLRVPYFDEYFCVWALQPEIALALHNSFMAMDLQAHVARHADLEVEAQQGDGRRGNASFDVVSDVAIIPIHGTLMKQTSSFSRGSSTVQIRRQVRAAAADESIKAIFLHVESPGGAVPGTAELADDILAARERKPVNAFIEDVGASAAFWILSGANFISANRMAFVGSIGTFAVLTDLSEMAKKMGADVLLFKAGEFKGAGMPGTVITDEQKEMFQARIDKLNDQFLAGLVKTGRFTLARARELNDGRALIAKDALAEKMIDKVETFDQALSRVIRAGRTRSRTRAEILQIGDHAISLGPAQSELIHELQTHQRWPDEWNVNKQSELIEQSDQDEAEQNGPVSVDTSLPESGESHMSDNTKKAATIGELRQACQGASDGFILAQLESGASIEDAKDAHIKELQKSNEALKEKADESEKAKVQAETDKAKAEADARKKKGGGDLPAVGDETPAQYDNAGAEWNKLIKQEMKDSGVNRAQAVANVDRDNPGLRQAFVDQHNEKHHARRKAG